VASIAGRSGVAGRGGRIAARRPIDRPEVRTMAADDTPTIFHNPQCSKSRQAKEVLEDSGVRFELVEYLKAPPSRADLERIVDLIEDPPAALVRSGDPKFKALGLTKGDYTTKAEVVDLLVEHPELMERPVVVAGDRAVIGRPTERVNALVDGLA
jgi:arsenate reductase